MSGARAYTNRQFALAVTLAAVLGWAAFCTPLVVAGPVGMLAWYAAIGLPIALGGCWAVGGPILWRLMARPVGWARAGLWGGGIAAILVAISIAIGRFVGWRMSRNPNSSSQIGGGDHVQSVDGILTTFGWFVLAQRTALFVLLGAAVALIVRAVIGPGRAATISPPPPR